MSKLHVRQISAAVLGAYGAHLPPELDDDARLSQSLAAFALERTIGLAPESAAARVVDGEDDNGIDAIAVDTESPRVVLIQSKWDKSGSKGPRSDDIHKFCQGLRDLIDGRWDRFNSRINYMKTDLEEALDETGMSFLMVLAHTGDKSIAAPGQRVVDDLLSEMNDTTHILTFEHWQQVDIYGHVSAPAVGEGVDLEVLIKDWGFVEDPYTAFYGTVAASEIAEWHRQHGNSLFDRNIRQLLTDSSVNADLVETLRNVPDHFWYFNNGITVLCESLEKTVMGGSKRQEGVFRAERASVVNGAQTVGSVRAAADADIDLEQARVAVRFISLEGSPEEFDKDVTRATNTQNRVERRDFVALDPEQERLRVELHLEFDKRYSVKSGEVDPARDEGCSVVDATIALACLHSSNLAVQAKREIGRLWDSIDKNPYRQLFNERVTAVRLWRAVMVMRLVDDELVSRRRGLSGRPRSVTVHGNRLCLHLVFSRLDTSTIDSVDADWSEVLERVPAVTQSVITEMARQVEADFEGNYIASLFKNQTRCMELVDLTLVGLRALEIDDTSVVGS